MEVTISVKVMGPQDLEQFSKFISSMEQNLGGNALTPTGKKAKKTATTKTADEAEEDFGLDDETVELSSDDDIVETEETEEDETPTLKDVQTSLAAYAKKHSREKAGKILAKFKAKNVNQLKPKQYADVILLARG